MKPTEANIDITRRGNKLFSVSLNMPTWSKCEDDRSLSVHIPLLGIKTFAHNKSDTEDAIREAIKSFCIASDKFGQGIEKELAALGWKLVKDGAEHTELGFTPNDDMLEQIMQTGDQYAEAKLEFA